MKASYAKSQRSLEAGDLELILAVARGRTLNGAAARLGVDASTVFRSLRRLEATLGERLFERNHHGYQPTELARELASYAERIESQVQEAREAASSARNEPSGAVRLTTTDAILHGLLMPALASFSTAYPRIELELMTTNTLADLSRRDADIAIRPTRKPPEHLVGSRLGTLSAAVFASKALVDQGRVPQDLAEADWIGLDDAVPDHPSIRWRRKRYPKVVPRYRCNSVLSVAGAVVQGLGVGAVPVFLLRGHPQVEIVSGPLDELETDLWMLAHPEIRHLQRVKKLFDHFREHLML